MKIDAKHYFCAATERMNQARILYGYDGGYCFALSMYTAGVAVECMLRAFKLRRTSEFDERHDLLRLFRESGMLQINEDDMVAKGVSHDRAMQYTQDIRAAASEVYNLWANDYRYASESRLKSELNRMKQYDHAKGDVLKASALRLLNAAQALTDRGTELWKNSTRK